MTKKPDSRGQLSSSANFYGVRQSRGSKRGIRKSQVKPPRIQIICHGSVRDQGRCESKRRESHSQSNKITCGEHDEGSTGFPCKRGECLPTRNTPAGQCCERRNFFFIGTDERESEREKKVEQLCEESYSTRPKKVKVSDLAPKNLTHSWATSVYISRYPYSHSRASLHLCMTN